MVNKQIMSIWAIGKFFVSPLGEPGHKRLAISLGESATQSALVLER